MKLRRILLLFLPVLGLCACFTAFANSHYQGGSNQVTVGFSDRNIAYFKIPTPPSPLFWRAGTEATRGMMLRYTHIFYRGWHFTFSYGASASNWMRPSQGFVAIAGFLQMRFWLFFNHYFSGYVLYSIAGPSYLTRRRFSRAYFSENIVFQDYLGAGLQFGAKKAFNLEVMVLHYSNGDIFTHNSGIQVPVIISLGYTF